MGIPVGGRSHIQATKTAIKMKINKQLELALELRKQGYSPTEVQPSRRVEHHPAG